VVKTRLQVPNQPFAGMFVVLRRCIVCLIGNWLYRVVGCFSNNSSQRGYLTQQTGSDELAGIICVSCCGIGVFALYKGFDVELIRSLVQSFIYFAR
jgi:hypothetical protein